MALQTFQIIAFLDGCICQGDACQNPVLGLIFFSGGQQQIRVEEQTYRVAALDAVPGSMCNIQASAKIDLTKQLQKHRFRNLTGEAETVANQACCLQCPQFGWILLSFIRALANVVQLDSKIINEGMRVRVVADRSQFAQIAEQQLIPRESLDWPGHVSGES